MDRSSKLQLVRITGTPVKYRNFHVRRCRGACFFKLVFKIILNIYGNTGGVVQNWT